MNTFLERLRQATRRNDQAHTQHETLTASDPSDVRRELPSYEQALEQVGAHSPVVAEISEDYERFIDAYDPDTGTELQDWEDYFVESLDVRRAYGYLDDAPTPPQVFLNEDAAVGEDAARDSAEARTDQDELSTAFPDFDQACSQDASYFAAQLGDIDEL